MFDFVRQRLRHYVLLMRLDRPVGILLLLWPTLCALWIAAKGWPKLYTLLVFVVLYRILAGTGRRADQSPMASDNARKPQPSRSRVGARRS